MWSELHILTLLEYTLQAGNHVYLYGNNSVLIGTI